MRLYLYFRFLGAVIGGWLGWTLSSPLWDAWNLNAPIFNGEVNGYRLIPTAIGAVVGAAVVPHVTIDPFMFSRRALRHAPASDLVGIILQ